MKRDIRISIHHIRRKKKVQRKVQLLQLKFDSTFYVNESKLLSSSSRFKNHKLKGFCHFLASLRYTVLVSYSSRKLNKIKCIIWLSKKLAEIIVKKLSASNSLAHSLTHTHNLYLSLSLSLAHLVAGLVRFLTTELKGSYSNSFTASHLGPLVDPKWVKRVAGITHLRLRCMD